MTDGRARQGPLRARPRLRREHPVWAGRIERLLAIAGVLWLQIVGVVTGTIAHHVLHAAPIVVLTVLHRSVCVRQTIALTGLAWIIMLALISPMIRETLLHGIVIGDRDRAFTWLAPGMTVISAAWAGLSIAILRHRVAEWAWWVLALLFAAILMALAQPWVATWYEIPLQRILDGEILWFGVLLIEVTASLMLPWWSLRLLTPRQPVTARGVCWQAAYWMFFLACMVLGLMPAVN